MLLGHVGYHNEAHVLSLLDIIRMGFKAGFIEPEKSEI